MTRANVSYHVTQLEKAVGTQFVRRTPRQVEPVELGHRLYAHVLSMRNEALAALETIATLSTGPHSRASLSVPRG